jgi:hypothetical protein
LPAPDRDVPPWSETLSEWFGCIGVGLIPLLTNLAVAIFVEQPRIRAVLLSLGVFLGEIFLLCFVTIAASMVVYISKYNVVRVLSRISPPPRLPTSLFFVPMPLLIVMVIIYVAIRTSSIGGLAAMGSAAGSLFGTIVLSLTFERVIGKAVYASR